ncbi:hypothetical protein ACM66T_01880 [Sulfurimonas sp. ST-25]|uniref:hypothetical protein n=1 Tax=Sulfurimonas sp. ST-25 TaxID=3400151 RepID=UPI003A86CA3F
MTAMELERSRMADSPVYVNPFLLFIILLVAPYLFFLGLLMIVTGELDILLLIETVWQGEWSAYTKTWAIGSFVLALLGALFFGGYRTERYLLRKRSSRSVTPQRGVQHSHFVIEAEPEPKDETRYADLDDAMESPKQ